MGLLLPTIVAVGKGFTVTVLLAFRLTGQLSLLTLIRVKIASVVAVLTVRT